MMYDNNINPYMGMMGNNPYYNNGAYPNGYAPPTTAYRYDQQLQSAYQSPYSAFSAPRPYTPGMVNPIRVESSDGSVRYINNNQQQTTPYIQGGSMVNQGGFNPVSGSINQSGAYAPYNNYNYNYYGANNNGNNRNMIPMAPTIDNSYYNRLRTGPGENPYMSPQYGYIQGYPYNQFDYSMQDFLYNEDPSDTGFDVEEMLSGIILSDKEREKISHNKQVSYIVGHDYFGNPIYSSGSIPYQSSQNIQDQIIKAREEYQDHFVRLAKIAAAYDGSTVDEEKVRKAFDPLPQLDNANRPAPRVFNYHTASEEEKKEYSRNLRLEETFAAEQRCNEAEACIQRAEYIKQQCYAKIKESHDKLIGVQPGEHYSLSQFLTEGYKIGLNVMQQKLKSQNRNGQNKYHRNDYRAGLAQSTNTPIPIESRDDSYVTIEECIKSMYEKNKSGKEINSVLITLGDDNYKNKNITAEEQKHHLSFMETMQEKKVIDDARRGV